jgi:hypothetical protein
MCVCVCAGFESQPDTRGHKTCRSIQDTSASDRRMGLTCMIKASRPHNK